MKKNLRLFLIFNACMLGLLLAPLHGAFAQSKYGSEKALSLKSRDIVVREHIENTKAEPQLSWPPFPRVWMERSSTRMESSNTAAGFSLSIGGGPSVGPLGLPGFSTQNKRNYDYKFTVTTSLILISSTEAQSINALTARPHSDYEQVVQDELFLTSKPGTSMVYPLITNNKPMVGLCYFEMNLSEEHSHTKGVELFGSGTSSSTGTGEMGKVSRFSNFFQIRPDVAVESYHYDVCHKIFKNQVESSVLKNFSLLVYQLKNNNCSPPPPNDIDSKGDLSCENWFADFDSVTKHATLPRCEQGKDGGYRCVLRTKLNNMCKLYQDRKTGERSEKFDFKRFDMAVSKSYNGIGCDKAMKQSCKMTSEPTMLLGAPLIKGTARCQ